MDKVKVASGSGCPPGIEVSRYLSSPLHCYVCFQMSVDSLHPCLVRPGILMVKMNNLPDCMNPCIRSTSTVQTDFLTGDLRNGTHQMKLDCWKFRRLVLPAVVRLTIIRNNKRCSWQGLPQTGQQGLGFIHLLFITFVKDIFQQ